MTNLQSKVHGVSDMELENSKAEVELEKVRSQIDRFVSRHGSTIEHQMQVASECDGFPSCGECNSCLETKLLRELQQLLCEIELRSSLLKRNV